ncbi:MAG TPA: peptidoglycan DD-metalloendopeptidase family protein [Thermoanaerobaculia bacterium]|nr:peptidoglycan DD-metalloendopeptidase family protein [Thermoanaerobaculia bacterium]
MAGQHNTIIFVPHAHAKLRKWRVTNLQIGLVAGAFLLVTLGSAYFIWSHFKSPANPVEVTRLQKENQELRQVNRSFEESVQKLQEQLSSYEDRTRDLAIVAGVESLGDGIEAGIGGGAPDEVGLTDLPKIQARAARLDGVLDTVENRLEQRMRWISSTPAISPVRGILTSGFGGRVDPMTHGHGNHQGVDIAAAYGQPVHASGDGLVIQAGEQGGLGRAVFIAHGYGLTTRYGHMSAITVRPGQRVKRGDIVGRVGSTGRSTGPHLHYEVRLDGEPLNPVGYILDNGSGPL